MLRFLNTHVVPALTTLSTNIYLSAVRAGMVAVVPLTIIGGLFMIVAYLPVAVLQGANQRFDASLIAHFSERNGRFSPHRPIGVLEQIDLDFDLILDLLFFKDDLIGLFRRRLNRYRVLSRIIRRHLIGQGIGRRL